MSGKVGVGSGGRMVEGWSQRVMDRATATKRSTSRRLFMLERFGEATREHFGAHL